MSVWCAGTCYPILYHNKTLGVISKFRLSANLVTDSHEASALVALLVPEGVQITVF